MGSQWRIRAGIDAEMLMLRNRAANEDLDAEGRANVELRLKLVMAHARYRGWLVDKKQVAKVTAHMRVDKADLQAAIAQDLEALELWRPGPSYSALRLARSPRLTALGSPPSEV